MGRVRGPAPVVPSPAKNRLGALLGYVVGQHDEVIDEHQGKPRTVLTSFTAFEEVEALRAEKRRAEALAHLRRLEQRIADHNRDSDLTEEEAQALADNISHEIVDDLAARGVVTFERDRR